jgi:hypothetical protein
LSSFLNACRGDNVAEEPLDLIMKIEQWHCESPLVSTEKCSRPRHDDVHFWPEKLDFVTYQAQSAQSMRKAFHGAPGAEKE